MSEMKLLPCPHCGGTDLQIDWNGVYERHFVRCYNYDCHMQGPEVYGRSNAAKAWNAIPRALVWTKEAPKVPGWYWCRDYGKYIHIVHVGVDLSEYQEIRDVEWAGPISEPREQK